MTVTLEGLRGRVGDVDSHEQIPVPRWPEVFGEAGRRFLELNEGLWKRVALELPEGENSIFVDRPDNVEISEQTVWEKRSQDAPSASNMDRRPQVLDVMGIRCQLVFPTFGLFALANALGGGINGMATATPEQVQNGKDSLNAYNSWAGRLTGKYPDRLRIV